MLFIYKLHIFKRTPVVGFGMRKLWANNIIKVLNLFLPTTIPGESKRFINYVLAQELKQQKFILSFTYTVGK